MAGSTAYCTVDQLLLGNIPLPGYIDPQKFVDDAGDEIDSKIGFRYLTPVDVSAVSRPVMLFLKRMNVHLASGRLLLDMDASGENERLHAYALSLIQGAQAALDAIASGGMDLGDLPPSDDEPQTTGPMISNLDAESNVESFFNRIANPNYSFNSIDGRVIL